MQSRPGYEYNRRHWLNKGTVLDQRTRRLNALERHSARLQRRLDALHTTSERLTRWRLAVFLGGAAATFAGLAVDDRLGLLVLIMALAVFGVLVVLHRRVRAGIDRFAGWRGIKQTHIARMRLDWQRLPPAAASAPAGHPFALDLDIVGEHSIHRLLDTTASHGGAQRLRDWLLADGPDPQQIDRRQALVREIMPLTGFRDRLALAAALAVPARGGGKWDGDRLLNWLQTDTDTIAVRTPALLGLLGLAALNVALFALSAAGVLPPLWVGTFIVFVALSSWQWRRLGDLFSQVLRLKTELTRLRAVLHHLETFRYGDHAQLRGLCAPFLDPARPSAQLRRVDLISGGASIQHNPVLWLMLNLVMPWDIGFAYLLERSKGDLARVLPGWLDAWYEVEALNALANFAHLNPGAVFPVVRAGAVFAGERLGHPMIAAEERVCNDFDLEAAGRVVIITGSNMSGKSSFLRTLGVNTALAYAGGVVIADRLEVGLFRLFTCIRVADSVVDGISYFYAEVKRLKALLAALRRADGPPLFFLIDEIFRGTNNRERLIGSRAYIRALAGERSVGLVATHDLELVHLEDDIADIRNVHFREDVIDGRMVFDYRLRSGPSPTTNALKIMALEGLPVDGVAAP